jgi:hypothetical protein
VEGCGTAVAKHRIESATPHRSEPPAALAQGRGTDGVDAPADAVQKAAAVAPMNGLLPQTEGAELIEADESVLTGRELRDQGIDPGCGRLVSICVTG